MASYLVTGIAGFIGAALASALIEQGHEVVGMDNLSTGQEHNIPPQAQWVKADCGDAHSYTHPLVQRPFAAIFHIAGQSSGEISFDDPVYDLRTNTESTLHLLQLARKTGCQRLVYASTMSVYGIQPDRPVQEHAPTMPQSFYGVGKLASEHYLRLYAQYGIASTALRLFNVYGPGQNMHNMRQGMVSIFMSMMQQDKHIHVKGSAERYRDFVYIDDVVQAFLRCLEHPASAGKELNIGGSGKVYVRELIAKLCALQPDASLPVTYQGTTAGDIHGIYADISAATSVLGYTPTVSLEEGLRRMYAWYCAQ